jgi:NADH-quinone oxidoreductase subunit N
VLQNPVFGIHDFAVIVPECLLALAAVLVLALDIALRSQASKRALEALSAAALLGCLAWFGLHRGQDLGAAFNGLVAESQLINGFRLGLVGVGLLTLVLTRQLGARMGLLHGEFYALLLFALAGMSLLLVARDLMLAFVALETFSLAMYVMAGFNKAWHGNREAAIKYFLLGAFAAAFFLLGLAMVFGTTGSVSLDKVHEVLHGAGIAAPRLLLLKAGLVLCASAFAFKIGAAPFHLWVPDVYSGATTPVTAFLSAGAKLAGFGALINLLGAAGVLAEPFSQVIIVLAVLTLLAGNLGALKQTELKRLLAYSSIAHSGYALVGLLGLGHPDSGAAGSVLAYVLVYGVMNFLGFALVAAGEKRLAEQGQARPLVLADLQGTGFERPLFGLALAVAMVSMAGLPPTAGFIVKFGVFKSALAGGHSTAAVFAILNSVVSAAVYLRVLVALYMLPKQAQSEAPALGLSLGAVAWGAVALLLVLGVLPASLSALSGL